MIQDLIFDKDTERYEPNEKDAFGPFSQPREGPGYQNHNFTDHRTITSASEQRNATNPLVPA